jgi:hypothetical protein
LRIFLEEPNWRIVNRGFIIMNLVTARILESVYFLAAFLVFAGFLVVSWVLGAVAFAAGLVLLFFFPCVYMPLVFFCGRPLSLTEPKAIFKADRYFVSIAGAALMFTASMILVFLGSPAYFLLTQGVVTVTSQTNASSLLNQYLMQFDNSFNLNISALIEAPDLTNDYACYDCIAPIISSNAPNIPIFWAACEVPCDSNGDFVPCSVYLKEAATYMANDNMPTCLQNWLNVGSHGKGGSQDYHSDDPVLTALVTMAQSNFSFAVSPVSIFVTWQDIWSYSYSSLITVFGTLVAFNGVLLIYILTRRIFALCCCRIDPCTFERLE